MFKHVAVVAKLRKRDFKPPDNMPRNYDQRPFHLDGCLELDIIFGDKTMKTVVYVKMDAREPPLLFEGVCHQLEIIQCHPDIVPRTSMGARERATSVAKEAFCSVPTIRVKLVQSMRLPPNQSVLTNACLTGRDSLNGPLLVESAASVVNDRGLQVTDSVVLPTKEGRVMVMLTNNSGITQRTDKGMVIGTASPAELVHLPESEHVQATEPELRESLVESNSPADSSGSDVDHEQSSELTERECSLQEGSVSLPTVRQASVIPRNPSSWRKQKLRELLEKECEESPVPETYKAQLIPIVLVRKKRWVPSFLYRLQDP